MTTPPKNSDDISALFGVSVSFLGAGVVFLVTDGLKIVAIPLVAVGLVYMTIAFFELRKKNIH